MREIDTKKLSYIIENTPEGKEYAVRETIIAHRFGVLPFDALLENLKKRGCKEDR